MRMKPSQLSKYQAGVGLLEILITLLVLSIGLLGLAALHATGLRQNHSAYLRTQATQLAYDIADRLRSNPQVAEAIRENSGSLANAYDIAIGDVVSGAPTCEGVACTPGQMADYDLSQWKDALAAALPLGDGAFARTGSVVTVTVSWDDSRSGATDCPPDPLPDPFDPNDYLRCFTMSFTP